MLTFAVQDWLEEQGLTVEEAARRMDVNVYDLESVLRSSHKVRAGLLRLGCPGELVYPEPLFAGEPAVQAGGAGIVGVVLLESRIRGGQWAYVDEEGNTIPAPGKDFFDTHPVFGGIRDEVIHGQHMVRIPKFYIKRETISSGANAGKCAWWLSSVAAPGFMVHPAFMRNGFELDHIHVGKYQASSSGGRLQSVPGVLPATRRSLADFQAEADARNAGGVTGFMLWSVYHWSAIQWLYLVEKATMDSQATTGPGRVDADGPGRVDAPDVAQAGYRGILGLWGNVWQWIDGLKTGGGSIHVWDTDGCQTWVDTGQRREVDDGDIIYPQEFMWGCGSGYDLSTLFIGDNGEEDQDEAVAPDLQWFGEKGRGDFPGVGGYWSFGSLAGLWSVFCLYSASGADASIGARLAKA